MSINTIIVDFLSSLSDLIKRKCKVVYTLYFLTLLVRMYFSFLFKCYIHRDHKDCYCVGDGEARTATSVDFYKTPEFGSVLLYVHRDHKAN